MSSVVEQFVSLVIFLKNLIFGIVIGMVVMELQVEENGVIVTL